MRHMRELLETRFACQAGAENVNFLFEPDICHSVTSALELFAIIVQLRIVPDDCVTSPGGLIYQTLNEFAVSDWRHSPFPSGIVEKSCRALCDLDR